MKYNVEKIHNFYLRFIYWHIDQKPKWKSILSYFTEIENDLYTLKESLMHILFISQNISVRLVHISVYHKGM